MIQFFTILILINFKIQKNLLVAALRLLKEQKLLEFSAFGGGKGNTRDLFDIAVAFHKKPNILSLMNLPTEKLEVLRVTLYDIKNDVTLSQNYLHEIKLMQPHQDYMNIALNTLDYLYQLILNHLLKR